MVYVGNTCPTRAVKRQAHGVFGGWNAGFQIGGDGVFNVQALPVVWVLPVVEQRRCMVGLRVPRSGIVVSIDGDEIHLRRSSAQVEVGVILRSRRPIEGEHVLLVSGLRKSVQLTAELRQQSGEVVFIGGGWKLPIDVEAIEQPRRRNAGSDVAFDKHVDAGGGQGATSLGRACRGVITGCLRGTEDKNDRIVDPSYWFSKRLRLVEKGRLLRGNSASVSPRTEFSARGRLQSAAGRRRLRCRSRQC